MKAPFDETRLHPDCDPADCAGCAQFDYEEVYERLDGTPQPGACPKALIAFSRLLRALLPDGRPVRHIVGLRVIALAWTLNPGNIAGSPSVKELARRCGVTPEHMAKLTGQMSRLAEWRNRAQQRAKNWRKDGGGASEEISLASPPTTGLKPSLTSRATAEKTVSHEKLEEAHTPRGGQNARSRQCRRP